MPAADTGGAGTFTASYYANDFVRSIAQNGLTQTFDLDPTLRISTKTKSGSSTSTESYAYADDSDSPAWTAVTSGSTTTWNRTVDGIAGADAVQDSATGVKLMISNLRGDVVAQATTAGALSNISRVDEFGVPKAALPAGAKYAFHGSKQREALTAGGIVAMGVRLYQPQVGRFLQVDPVLGGTAGPYEYPSDPVNGFDLDGRNKQAHKLTLFLGPRQVQKLIDAAEKKARALRNRATISSAFAGLVSIGNGVVNKVKALAKRTYVGFAAIATAAIIGAYMNTTNAASEEAWASGLRSRLRESRGRGVNIVMNWTDGDPQSTSVRLYRSGKGDRRGTGYMQSWDV